MGSTIDLDEQQFFRLFPRIAGFLEARLVPDPASRGGNVVVARTNRPDTIIVVSAGVLRQMKVYIELHEDPAFITNEIDWEILAGYAAYVQRAFDRQPTVLRLVDGREIRGTLAWSSNDHFYVLPDAARYDWRSASTPVVSIPHAVVAEVGSASLARIATAARTGLRRNVLATLAVVGVVAIGNASAEPTNPGLIGAIATAGLGSIVSLRLPVTDPGPPYPPLSPSGVSGVVRDYAIYRTDPPPDLAKSAAPTLVSAVVPAAVEQTRTSRWRPPTYRVRAGISSPFSFGTEPSLSHYRSPMVGGPDSIEVVPLARTAPWHVDLSVRAIGGLAVGVRYSRTAIPEVESGQEYLRGQTVHPYVQYAIVMRFTENPQAGRGLFAAASIGPGLVYGTVEHVVAPLAVLEDQRLPMSNERSTYSWRSVDVGATLELGIVLSRYAILGVAYTRWIGRTDVPQRVDMIHAPEFTVVLHEVSPYQASLQKHEVRLGISLSI